MPEGRAVARGRSGAKSIDGAEHSGILKGVMAVVPIALQQRSQIRCYHRRKSRFVGTDQIPSLNGGLIACEIAGQIASTVAPQSTHNC